MTEWEKKTGVKENTYDLFAKLLRMVAPPPEIKLSEWADKYRRLSSEDSPEPGRWSTDRAPYQREPMNAITDSHTHKVVLKWASQTGKTTGVILNAIGYFMQNEPGPMMALQPTVEMAETFSKNRLSPMLRDSPTLAELCSQRSRDRNNTILEKQFPGGYIAIQGGKLPDSAGLQANQGAVPGRDRPIPGIGGHRGRPAIAGGKADDGVLELERGCDQYAHHQGIFQNRDGI